MKNSFALALVLIISLIPDVAIADNYKELRYMMGINSNEGSVVYIDGSKTVIHGKFDQHEEYEKLVTWMKRSASLSREFSKNMSSTCDKRSTELHIYYAPFDIVNNRSIMDFIAWHKWDNKNIYGAFDSTMSPKNTVSVFISSDIREEKKEETVSHEIFHYWQYRKCLGLEESPAIDFEKYYERNK